MTRDGRVLALELEALREESRAQDDAPRTLLGAPRPGLHRDAPAPGALLRPGMSAGELEVLGKRYRLVVPAGASGVVVGSAPARGRRPVAFGETLLTLDPSAALGGEVGLAAGAHSASGGLAFVSPMAGRYYARPAPDAEAFVAVGAEISTGTTVALLEVMKTFNRVQYGGPGLPARARVVAIVPADGDDVASGAPILELEAL